MDLQNHYLDQDKSFQKLLKFRTWFCLCCTLYCNIVCFTSGVYFWYFKKKSLPYFTPIHKYFIICPCSKPMDLNIIILKASCCLCLTLLKGAFSLQISCFDWATFDLHFCLDVIPSRSFANLNLFFLVVTVSLLQTFLPTTSLVIRTEKVLYFSVFFLQILLQTLLLAPLW